VGQPLGVVAEKLVEFFTGRGVFARGGAALAGACTRTGFLLNPGPELVALVADGVPLAAERLHDDRLDEREDVFSAGVVGANLLSSFGLRHSSLFRHSDFGLRHFFDGWPTFWA